MDIPERTAYKIKVCHLPFSIEQIDKLVQSEVRKKKAKKMDQIAFKLFCNCQKELVAGPNDVKMDPETLELKWIALK